MSADKSKRHQKPTNRRHKFGWPEFWGNFFGIFLGTALAIGAERTTNWNPAPAPTSVCFQTAHLGIDTVYCPPDRRRGDESV